MGLIDLVSTIADVVGAANAASSASSLKDKLTTFAAETDMQVDDKAVDAVVSIIEFGPDKIEALVETLDVLCNKIESSGSEISEILRGFADLIDNEAPEITGSIDFVKAILLKLSETLREAE